MKAKKKIRVEVLERCDVVRRGLTFQNPWQDQSLPELSAFWKLPPSPCDGKREEFCSPFRLVVIR